MTLEWGRKTYVMGVVNVTPDSFSGDGITNVDEAVHQGILMEKEGADILDIGGESTRPGSQPVGTEDELARVIPVIEKLQREVSIPISIDTYKAEVARLSLRAGASMINDVWGGRMEPEILQVAADANVPIILMHNRSKPSDATQDKKLGGRYEGVEYVDLIEDIKNELMTCVLAALAAGVKEEKIIVDPGIGFGKTTEHNLDIVRRLSEFKSLGYPILVGPSRKSFVGYTLDLPPEERLEGTAAAVALSIAGGADIVRVHDVGAMFRVTKFTDAVVRRQ